MDKNSRIYVAGHRGIAGSALVSYLKEKGHANIITKTHAELDLCDTAATEKFFQQEKPEYIFFAAANACGISNSQYRADFIYQNTMMQSNIIHLSYKYKVKKLLCYSSGYVYPRDKSGKIDENNLLQGELEYFCEPYAVAKINMMKMCEAYNIQYGTNFLCALLVNLYGNNGSFALENARVMHALIRKMHLGKLFFEKKYDELLHNLKLNELSDVLSYLNKFGLTENSVEIWGTGKSKREFLHSYDMADASYHIMNKVNFADCYDHSKKEIRNTHINMGSGIVVTIKELAELIKEIVDYPGELFFNADKPDSKMDRITDCTKLSNLGWKSKIDLKTGISMMYDWYKMYNK